MVNLNDLYTAIQAILKNDDALSGYLSGGGNKIYIGRELPTVFALPAVQIVGLTDTLYVEGAISDIILRTNAYISANANGTIPHRRLSEILDRVYELLNNQPLTVTGGYVYGIFAENRDADALRDSDYRGTMARFLMGIEWRTIAR